MPAPRRVPPPPSERLDRPTGGAVYEAFADASEVDELPVEAARVRRPRTRRGGGRRTPMPLILGIALASGIGVAYVSQTAHVTQGTYEATRLAADNTKLHDEDQRLGDELARLRSSARINQAAGQLGLRPPARWAYVPSVPQPVALPPAPDPSRDSGPSDPLQRLVAALSGSFGGTRAEAAPP